MSKIFPNLNLSGGVDPRLWNLSVEEKATVVANRTKRQNNKQSLKNIRLKEIATDQEARQRGPQIKKSFKLSDLKEIEPLTTNQERALLSWDGDKNLFLSGSAGTGKSFLACYMALEEVLSTDTLLNKVVIIRSAQQSKVIGFTPGDINEKIAPYEAPYIDIFAKLLPYKTSYESAKQIGLLEFHSTSFLRGLNLDNCVLIFDEVQNSQWNEVNLVITRLGENSRVILCGDNAQTDLNEHKHETNCIRELLEMVEHYMPTFENIRFTAKDCVRSGLVKEWLLACEKIGKY